MFGRMVENISDNSKMVTKMEKESCSIKKEKL